MYRINIFVLMFTMSASVEGGKVKSRGYSIEDSTFSYTNEVAKLAQNFKKIEDIFSVFDLNQKYDKQLLAPEDTYLNISQLITKYGYKFEEHRVITDDGHILGIHRLLAKNKTLNGKLIFLMHGILDSSDGWILQGPNKSLGYRLADCGFDVWMGNARGNKYSMEHTSLDNTTSDFWDFSWEEIGLNDLPAMIDYVLNITKQHNLYYIGHSQGTTVFYVLNSMKPEYNKKIKSMFALAPVAWMSNAKSPIAKFFSPAQSVLSYILSFFNQYTVSTDFFNSIAPTLCILLPGNCDNMVSLVFGTDMNNINNSMLPVIFGHMPTGSSVSQFIHYGQLVQSQTFSRYDYGTEMNIQSYGQPTPPEYDINNIKVPIYLFYADNDCFSDPKDVLNLQRNLPNVKGSFLIEHFGHLEFLYSAKARDLIYDKIVQIIESDDEISPQIIFHEKKYEHILLNYTNHI